MDLMIAIDDSEFELANVRSLSVEEGEVSVTRDRPLSEEGEHSQSTFTGELKQITVIGKEELDRWRRWEPCPECGSTTFEQTEKLTVHGNKSGNYNGDDGDHRERIECAECGKFLE